jgi:hypothetical protein
VNERTVVLAHARSSNPAATMATDEQEAAVCCAAVLEAMREPGFRTVCDGLLRGSSGGVLFLECPLAALKTVAKLLPMTADRPAEQRFKPLLMRMRAVATSELHLVRARCADCVRHPAAAATQGCVRVRAHALHNAHPRAALCETLACACVRWGSLRSSEEQRVGAARPGCR